MFGKSRFKYGYVGKTAEPAYPEKAAVEDKPASPPMPVWLKGPRMVQLNAGRFEVSIPYQLAIAILLGLALLILVAFRLGQISSAKSQQVPAPPPKAVQKASPVKIAVDALQTPGPVEKKTTPAAEARYADASKGSNRIVIQSYHNSSQLEPVSKYFADNGIETEIRKINEVYYLVTKARYENPEKSGTDGYAAKQKIIELGGRYKSPPGYDNFGTRPFHDAYGMKFEE